MVSELSVLQFTGGVIFIGFIIVAVELYKIRRLLEKFASAKEVENG